MNDQSRKKSVSRIVFLDYLRVFAFASVLIGHKLYGQLVSFTENPTVHATPRLIVKHLLPFFEAGGAGVVVFFLVSGYIVTYALQRDSAKEFLFKRIFRIYPLYIVAVLLEKLKLYFMGYGAPELTSLIPQFLLIGDLFGTSYTLGSVEWTLRVEVFFYLYIALLRHFGFLNENRNWLLLMYTISVLVLVLLGPLPTSPAWSRAYITAYSPFLLLGSLFCAREANAISSWQLSGFTLLVFAQYFFVISIYNPRTLNSHFAIMAFFLFFFAWFFRSTFSSNGLVVLLSELTFSVYLFHNWAWDVFQGLARRIPLYFISADLVVLFFLFLFCYVMTSVVEKPAIRLGRYLLKNGIKYPFKGGQVSVKD
jgi:peptidoglycan/LPS O-acetylase OafA/YrhL